MALSKQIQSELRDAALVFAQAVASLVARESVADAVVQISRRLDQIAGGAGRSVGARGGRLGAGTAYGAAGTRGRRLTPGGRSPAVKYSPRLVERLIAVIEAEGGTALPNVISKRLGLSPFQRRRLVDEAIKTGRIKTTGNRRSTKYVLPGKRRGKAA
ncbi:MAG TPA: hypothetical protein VG389_24635 [Myxococcota bacterium]|jgi:hypothetical protein|nr:hypothetical protein [Myxococcota bacterium]